MSIFHEPSIDHTTRHVPDTICQVPDTTNIHTYMNKHKSQITLMSSERMNETHSDKGIRNESGT